MRCILCTHHIDLWDLDAEGYSGDPAHTVCAEAARQAWRDALDWAAAQRVEREARRQTAA